MVSLKRAAGIIGVLTLGIANSAQADFERFAINTCGGTTFTTCASVLMRYSLVGGGHYLTLSVWNKSGLSGTPGGTVFTAIGLRNLPVDAMHVGRTGAVSGPTRASNRDATNNWYVQNDRTADGELFDIYTSTGVGAYSGREWGIANNCDLAALPAPLPAVHPSNSLDLWMNPACGNTDVANPTTNDGFVNIRFRLTGALTQQELDNTVVGLRGVAAADLSVTYLTTPEPTTVLLLVSGLIGIGGVGLRRRQRSVTEEH